MKDEIERFQDEVKGNITALAKDDELKRLSRAWLNRAGQSRYTYNFSWMGVPIIQIPQDIMAMQEIIWLVRPDLIIETGVARGGSMVFYASMLELMGGDGRVVGIEMDLRNHNRVVLDAHPMRKRIDILEGSSLDPAIIKEAAARAGSVKSVLVSLDSNHTHGHVLAELEAYAPLVSMGSYLVVFDTVIECMPEDSFPDRPWGRGNSPLTAVKAFLSASEDFVIDKEVSAKLQLSVAPDGYLRRVR